MGNSKGHPIRWILSWSSAHRATAALFLAILILGRESWFPWAKGSLTCTRLFGLVPFTDPLSGIEVMLASRSFTVTLAFGIGATILIGALLGRVFCGWLCPLGMVLELCDHLHQKLKPLMHRWGLDLARFKLPNELKYWLLVLCLVLSLFSAMPVFTTVSPVNLVALSLVFSAGPELTAVGGLILFELFSVRAFCRAVCPLGGLYSLLGRFGLLRIRVREQCMAGLSCNRCTHECPMGIRVLEGHVLTGKRNVAAPECTRCGTCADGCPGGLLYLGFRDVRVRV